MTNKSYTLLVGVDFSELSDRALHEAFAQASQRANSEIHVVSVLPLVAPEPDYAVSVYATSDETAILGSALKKLRAHVELELEKFRAAHPAAQSNFRLVSHAMVDRAAHAIAQLASQLGADLIVIGTNGRKGLERILLGSVAEGIVRNAPCPVLVIPPLPEPDAAVTFAPPCPECLQARAASAGKEFWCEQHRERHGRRHTYHQSDRSGSEANFPLVFR